MGVSVQRRSPAARFTFIEAKTISKRVVHKVKKLCPSTFFLESYATLRTEVLKMFVLASHPQANLAFTCTFFCIYWNL